MNACSTFRRSPSRQILTPGRSSQGVVPNGDFESLATYYLTDFHRKLITEHRRALEKLEVENQELRKRLNVTGGDGCFRDFEACRVFQQKSPAHITHSPGDAHHIRPTPALPFAAPETAGQAMSAAATSYMAIAEQQGQGPRDGTYSAGMRAAGCGNQPRTYSQGMRDGSYSAGLRDGKVLRESELNQQLVPIGKDSEHPEEEAAVNGEEAVVEHSVEKMFELWPAWTAEAQSFGFLKKKKDGQGQTEKKMLARAPAEKRNHCLVVNPHGGICLVWNVFFSIVLCYELITFPMNVFNMPKSGFMDVMSWITLLFWTADLILTFLTGYHDSEAQLVRSHRLIAKKYFKSWFGPDVVVIMVDWLLAVASDSVGDSKALKFGKLLRYMRLARLLRLLRLRKLSEAMRKLDDILNSLYFSIIKSISLNMFIILAISHFIGCAWFALGRSESDAHDGCENTDGRSWVCRYKFDEEPWGYAYLTSLHWALTHYTPGGMHVQPQSSMERAFTINVLVMGMMIFSSIVSNITVATNALKAITARYDNALGVLRRFFRQHHISKDLLMRVTKYSDTIIRPRMVSVEQSEVFLLTMLPKTLYMEVILELYDQYLEVHPFFQALKILSKMVMQKICFSTITTITLSKGAELFGPGEVADSMYFVINGTLIYTSIDKSPAMLTEKQCFCEAVLWTAWAFQGRMVAVDDSELIALDSTKFRAVMAQHNGDMWFPRKYGTEFVRGMNELAGYFTEGDDDDITLDDLVSIETAISLLKTFDLTHDQKKREAEEGNGSSTENLVQLP